MLEYNIIHLFWAQADIQADNAMKAGSENPLFDPQNEPKYNISSIMAHKLPPAHVNHILMHLCTLLGHFDTNSMQ